MERRTKTERAEERNGISEELGEIPVGSDSELSDTPRDEVGCMGCIGH